MLVPSCRRTLPSCTLGHCGKPWQRRVASLFKSIIFSPPTCRQQVWPFAALAVMFSTALSAVEPLPGQELLRQQERERIQRERLEPSPDVRFELPQALSDSDHLPEQEVPCFIIHQIQLLGENASDFQWALHAANPEADPALGRCLGAAGINLSMKRIQNAIVARGYVTTRILAEPQDLNAGTLRLTLVPGRIRNIRFAEDSSSRATLWNAMPANPGDLLNLRDIEQALENFKRVPTSEADIQIVPAEGDHAQPGESDVLIHWKQKLPLRLSLSLDDSGSESTGKYQGNVALSLDHLLTLNFFLAQLTAFPTVPGTKHRIRQQDQPGTDRVVDPLATLGDGRDIAGHVGPAQLPLVGVDKPVAGVLVGHQHPVKLGAQQPPGRLLTTAIGRHEADGYLAQRQPHPAALSTPLMPGLIGMNVGGCLHLLFDGLVGRGEHGTHPPLRLTDGSPAKTQAEVLLELLLYLADALVKLAALQRDVAEQIGPHLAADVVWQHGLGRADTP